MDNPSYPKNTFISPSPERWAHPNSLVMLCSGKRYGKKRYGKKTSKMPPKQRKRAILSKGSSEARTTPWTSSPGAGHGEGSPSSWRTSGSIPSFQNSWEGPSWKGGAGSEEGSSCSRGSLQRFPTPSSPGLFSLLKTHESDFSSRTQ